MPVTADDTLLPFSLPPLCHKKVSAAFDGGTISSDGGVFLLAGADKRLGLIDRLASHIPDPRDPELTHLIHRIAGIQKQACKWGKTGGNPQNNHCPDSENGTLQAGCHDPHPCPS